MREQRGVLAEAEEGMRVRSEWIESYRAQQTDNQRKLSALSTEHHALEQQVIELAAKHSLADGEYQAKRALVEAEVQSAVEGEVAQEEPSVHNEEIPEDETEEERMHRTAREQLSDKNSRDNKVKQLVDERVNQHETVQPSKLGKSRA